jgi:hypothetical protein
MSLAEASLSAQPPSPQSFVDLEMGPMTPGQPDGAGRVKEERRVDLCVASQLCGCHLEVGRVTCQG